MKNLFTLLMVVIVVLTSSCKKENPQPNYVEVIDEPNVTNNEWDSDYQNGGTLPNNTNQYNDDLVGTKWVITKVVTNYDVNVVSDTLFFVSTNKYTINNGSLKTYQLSLVPNSNSLELRLNYCYTIGNSIMVGNLSKTFINDGVVNSAPFRNELNQNDIIRLVTMHKI